MITGGILEGLKKVYLGKERVKTHLILLLICFITIFPCLFVEGDINIISIAHVGLWALILYFAGCFLLSMYAVHFTHNALKLFVWNDHQEDPTKANSLEIAPKFNRSLFNHGLDVILYGIAFIFVYTITLIPFAIGMMIPVLGWIAFIIATFVVGVSGPQMFIGFCKNFKISDNISPALFIQYFPKVILPTIVLGLKMFVFVLVIALIVVILSCIFFFLPKMARLQIITTISLYAYMIGLLVYQYALAFIYYDRIEMYKEI